MSKIPSIKSSAQARLLLYRLLSLKLNDVQKHLLDTNPYLWEKLLAELEKNLELEVSAKTEQIKLTEIFEYIEKSTKDGLQQQIKKLTVDSLWLGIKATNLLDDFLKEHLKLIKSVKREHLDKIGLAIQRGLRQGFLQKDILKEIKNVTNISKRRASLIARNAPLQYSGALTKYHQTSAGIKRYKWQSSGDERVRSSHRAINGKIYNWSDPGPHPRSEINCRCDAVPVVG